MEDPKTSPSTSETVGEMPANNTSISQPVHEQSDSIRPVPIPQNGTDLPTKMDVPPPPAPPPYDKDNADKQATPVANNNPYPGYDPSHVRIAVTPLERLGEVPAHINCPFCNTISLTTVTKTDSSQTTCASPRLFSLQGLLLTDFGCQRIPKSSQDQPPIPEDFQFFPLREVLSSRNSGKREENGETPRPPKLRSTILQNLITITNIPNLNLNSCNHDANTTSQNDRIDIDNPIRP
ncbi:hypothetical protein TCE0_042r15252 [Talaromyces pinophilus]|uniref:LITAF domain-containing protein n=1 Tax=Talaromyces pinophilus TaxID=128442 RepID=A0A6V8HJ07_TALPI|nr:hypothetical protein TCE0_042r15252 [Talaromyces pinophilus]